MAEEAILEVSDLYLAVFLKLKYHLRGGISLLVDYFFLGMI